jgi:nickel-type superoxide dismutase maturation protease
MEPSFREGDFLIVAIDSQLRVGDPAVVRDPRQPERELIKRVQGIAANGKLTLVGDNPGASTDSRTFGTVSPGLVIGRAILRYWPPGRVGLLRRTV